MTGDGGQGGVSELELARDVALARRMRRGDERAVAEFCTACLPRLYRFALHRLGDADDADDVVQTVLGKAARRIETYRGESTLQSWLYGICRRELSKHAAAAARHRGLTSLDAEHGLSRVAAELTAPSSQEPETASRHEELVGWVRERLDALPERHARALEMKYAAGFSSREIAASLDISDEAAQSLLARARRMFREVCDEQSLESHGLHNGEG